MVHSFCIVMQHIGVHKLLLHAREHRQMRSCRDAGGVASWQHRLSCSLPSQKHAQLQIWGKERNTSTEALWRLARFAAKHMISRIYQQQCLIERPFYFAFAIIKLYQDKGFYIEKEILILIWFSSENGNTTFLS